MQLPPPTYLTADLPGTGGLIKQHLTDFIVEEIPAYEADGVGTHCYIQLEKRNFSTMAAADILAKALGRKNMEIGYAGLKDKQAVTRQWFSVEHLESRPGTALNENKWSAGGIENHRDHAAPQQDQTRASGGESFYHQGAKPRVEPRGRDAG